LAGDKIVSLMANEGMATNRIRQLRLERGLSLTDLANELGISESHLSRVEAGTRGLHLSRMEGLARALGVPLTEILPAQAQSWTPDVAPYTPPKGSFIAKAAANAKTQRMFKVLTGVLSDLGIADGDPIIVETAIGDLKDLEPLTPLVLRLFPEKEGEPVLLLRQFLPPKLFVTNSVDHNAMPINMRSVKVEIVGRVLL
jgi:DNA-binding Xre family transcriptional regulator